MPAAAATRTTPRISVNKLGEYMVANAARRERIVQDQKTPPTFKAARYTEALDAMTAFFLRGGTDESVITGAMERLNAATPTTDWEEQRRDDCIEALEAILQFDDFTFLDGLLVIAGKPDQPKLSVRGVEISVRPELLLRDCERPGQPIVGAVKLSIGKTKPLNEVSASYIGTILHQYVEEVVPDGASAQFKKCTVVDVFARGIYVAPRSFTQRRQVIAAACGEIARAWPTA